MVTCIVDGIAACVTHFGSISLILSSSLTQRTLSNLTSLDVSMRSDAAGLTSYQAQPLQTASKRTRTVTLQLATKTLLKFIWAPPTFLNCVSCLVTQQWRFRLRVTLVLLCSSEATIATFLSLRRSPSCVPCACYPSEIPLFPAAADTRGALRAWVGSRQPGNLAPYASNRSRRS